MEYSSVQIFTRDRFGVTKRERRKSEREREKERERERKIKRKATYNNYPPVVTSNVSLYVLTSASLALKIK